MYVSTNHNLVVHYNLEGYGHLPLDSHASINEALTYKCRSSKALKTNFRRTF